MDLLDGAITNIFKTTKENVKLNVNESTELWICDYINQDTDQANLFVIGKLKELITKRDKLQFLYDCRTCVKFEITDIVTEYSSLCCPSRYLPPEVRENPMLLHEANKKVAKDLRRIPIIEEKLDDFNRALKRIECAIDYIEDCKKLDCDEMGISKLTLTNNQITLVFYYFLMSIGIKFRHDINISHLAKFIHLIGCKEFKSLNNSDIYKRLKKAPNFVKDKELIKDLEAIKPLFIKNDLKSVIQLINNEIDQAQSEIKEAQKTKL